jgi:hypothetical protein
MKHHLNLFFAGMSPEPDTEAEYDHQYRQTGDIRSFKKCLGTGQGVLDRVETLHFGAHDSNVFPSI